MRRFISLFLGPVFLMSFAVPASAGPVIIKDFKRSKSAWFYNKPGATVQDVNLDEHNCTAFGHYMFHMSPYDKDDPYLNDPGPGGAIIVGAVSSGPIRGTKDDCMMSLGYKRYNTKDDTLKDFLDRYNLLSEDEKNQYHGDVTPPEGTLHRQWVNTFWIPAEGEPKAEPESRNYLPVRQDLPKGKFIRWDKMKANKTMPVIGEGEEAAIVIAKIKPVSEKPAEIRFMRVDDLNELDGPSTEKQKNKKLVVLTLSQKNKKLDEYAVFKVPAGHYALNAVRHHAMCMKTVVFKAKSGQTIYLGDYTGYRNETQVHPLAPTPRARFRLDTGNLDAVKTDLNLSTDLIAADYQNNFPMKCPGAIGEKMYGVSFPGRPDYTVAE